MDFGSNPCSQADSAWLASSMDKASATIPLACDAPPRSINGATVKHTTTGELKLTRLAPDKLPPLGQ